MGGNVLLCQKQSRGGCLGGNFPVTRTPMPIILIHSILFTVNPVNYERILTNIKIKMLIKKKITFNV